MSDLSEREAAIVAEHQRSRSGEDIWLDSEDAGVALKRVGDRLVFMFYIDGGYGYGSGAIPLAELATALGLDVRAHS